ncbi:MAG: T9SS C-terminal target domain-containing protein [Ignavibacteriales bacterium]|nr:MAG: T9SS C-terminal target domain-containing protein [Ignavibacteriales bacterium]
MKTKYTFLLFLFYIQIVYSQSWQQQTTPAISNNNLLRTITAITPEDIWAAGFKTENNGNQLNLVLHFDGNEWNEIQMSNPGNDMNDIWGLSAISENEIWAAGVYNPPGTATQMQIQKWDGNEWSIYPAPTLTGGSFLYSIKAISGNDIWAVGTRMSREDYGPMECLSMHWDGNEWNEIPVPPVGTRRNSFRAVDGINSDDVWAVGHWTDQLGFFIPLAMHWNGNEWINYTISGGDELVNVYMISTNDVWAVGGGQFFHYDGNVWQQVNSPGGGSTVIKSTTGRIFSLGANVVEWINNQWELVADLSDIIAPAVTSAAVLPNGRIVAAGRKFVSTQTYSNLIVEFTGGNNTTGVADDYKPREFQLHQNYPNPFNPSTVIEYEIKNPDIVKIKVYNVLGKEICEMLNEYKNEGNYKIHFNALPTMTAGVYYYQITSGNFRETKKMILLR